MKLLLKFNLVFVAIFVLGLVSTGVLSRRMLERNALAEVTQSARLMMEQALAVRGYTSGQVAPLLQTQLKYGFLPQSVPAFSATEVLAAVQKKHPEYGYKEATLKPTNLRDLAVDWESDVIGRFRDTGTDKLPELVGQRDTATGRSRYVARPIKIADAGCLRCHSTMEAAPRPLVERYGPSNGFGWQLGEVVGAQIVSVPMAVPLARAHEAWVGFMLMLGGVFAAIGAGLNAMLWWLVVRPVTRLSRIADQVSLGEFKAPAFEAAARDEIGGLARSFTRMRRSLVQAMNMLEGAPA